MAKNKRFVEIAKGAFDPATVILDTETGVNYLFYQSGYAGGLTPLLDENGKIVVTPKDEIHKYL